MNPRIAKIVELLEHVANGRMDAADALEEWPELDFPDEDTVAGAWHHLWHYMGDADIRAKDDRYARYTTEELLNDAREISEKYSSQ